MEISYLHVMELLKIGFVCQSQNIQMGEIFTWAQSQSVYILHCSVSCEAELFVIFAFERQVAKISSSKNFCW